MHITYFLRFFFDYVRLMLLFLTLVHINPCVPPF